VELYREMAVGMTDRSEPDKMADPEAGLFPELPAGRRVGALARLDLSAREFPETR